MTTLRNAFEQTIFWLIIILAFCWMLAGFPAHPQSSTLMSVNGVQVERPTLPLYNARLYGWLPGQGVSLDTAGNVVPSFGPPVTASSVLTSIGDSITQGPTPNYTSDRFVNIIASRLGVSLNNYGIGGDQACDQFPKQIVANNVISHLDGNPIYTEMIGTNDEQKGVGAYESIFKTCHQAVLAWLLTPRENMVIAGDAAMTGSGSWSASITTANSLKYASAGSGSGVLTTSLVTYGRPIYGWYVLRDAADSSSCFSVSVDSKSVPGTFCTRPSVAMNTKNGTTVSVGFIRIPASAGTHSIVAQTTAGNVGIVGWGTMATTPYFGHVTLASGDVPNQNAGFHASGVATYTADVIADETIFTSDGADVRHVPDQKYMLGTAAEMIDTWHQTVLGAQHMASAYLQTLQAVPLGGGTTSTSASGSGYTQMYLCTVNPCPVPDGYDVAVGFSSTVVLPIPASQTQTGSTPGSAARITVLCSLAYGDCSVQAPTLWTLNSKTTASVSSVPITHGTAATFIAIGGGSSLWQQFF